MKELLLEKLEEVLRKYGYTNKISLERPKDENLGDYATNVAFLLAKGLGRNPMELAGELAKELSYGGIQASALRGFINFTFKEELIREEFRKLLQLGENYYKQDLGKGKRVLVEFVSANPTGPLHLGHGRGAVVGDVISRLLSECGYQVEKEYYINDAGYQVYLLGVSILYRYYQIFGVEDQRLMKLFEEEGYKGEYVVELAQKLKEVHGDKLLNMDQSKAIDIAKDFGVELLLEEIKNTLDYMGVHFDNWQSERSLYEEGLVEKLIEQLKERGLVYEKDGALWFASSQFGDDKDRVVRKSDGYYTYFASDIAYHYLKFQKGYHKAINVWGADHHGYLPRLKAALKALGIPDDWLSVEFVQMVRLFKEGKEVRMSKRAGTFVTLKELLDEVGSDAVRFVFLTKRSDTPLDVDVDILKSNTSENPVFYVQYAHARIRGVFREAKNRYGWDVDTMDFSTYLQKLTEQKEIALMKKTLLFKDEILDACQKLLPHLIVYNLIEISKDFHNYYNHYRIILEDQELTKARLALLKGLQVMLRYGLKLIGVNAPESM
ncbi:arginine--tRNA ligase [Thermocrinis minervae]|uniref:Arginine--tRNA ligase n=1 Tax=Thermocrinis minervae TaxID=381751 RepID=A0A1M6SRC5_9AQUI|nr:arginine--tRNA ligase [Thermocrinis minervae]SHK47271.1 arginyl-tRNA synthetase [Thermocrinis minervae]